MITTGSALSLLRPGLHDMWGLGYTQYPEQFSQIFEMLTSNMNYERDVNIHGLGMARVLNEGAPVDLDDMAEGFKYDYNHVDYSNGYKVSHNQIRDNLYMKFATEGVAELGNSHRVTKETVAARILNSATSNALTYADGQPLLSRSHLLSGGGTYSNMPDVDCDVSELALENAVAQIGGYTDDRGKLIQVTPTKVIVHRNSWGDLCRLLKSELRVGTPNNDLNAIKAENVFALGGMLYQYLDDPDAWFIQTNKRKGLRFFTREAYTLKSYIEDSTDSIIIKARQAYSAGCTDVMGIYGCGGA